MKGQCQHLGRVIARRGAEIRSCAKRKSCTVDDHGIVRGPNDPLPVCESCPLYLPRTSRVPQSRPSRNNVRTKSAHGPQGNASRAEIAPCQQRGALLRIGACDLCGTPEGKGTPFQVLSCELHGECSLERLHTTVRSCRQCLARGDNTPTRE